MSTRTFNAGDSVWISVPIIDLDCRSEPTARRWLPGRVLQVDNGLAEGFQRVKLELEPIPGEETPQLMPTWRWSSDNYLRTDDEHVLAALVL